MRCGTVLVLIFELLHHSLIHGWFLLVHEGLQPRHLRDLLFSQEHSKPDRRCVRRLLNSRPISHWPSARTAYIQPPAPCATTYPTPYLDRGIGCQRRVRERGAERPGDVSAGHLFTPYHRLRTHARNRSGRRPAHGDSTCDGVDRRDRPAYGAGPH
jgi:hypothetical protein